ncbi:MAG: hypothetical protein OK454_05880 [Thaumarchaeota archaeon]|nr:hypothetical protein [Nitrososphaerota archaeon]
MTYSSISSSPLWNPSHVTLSYSVLDSPSLSGLDPRHVGVASNYLSSLAAGDKLHVSVRPSHAAFHLPADAASVPVICIAAGTGLAPFRGFIQERAAMIGAGRSLAPALLFFGCRDPAKDDIYRDELDRWQSMGAVDVRRAYSRSDHADAQGCKYVQDRLRHDEADVAAMWERGARVYVCGSREVGERVKEVAIKMSADRAREKGGEDEGEARAEKWFQGIRNVRYATDVFD